MSKPIYWTLLAFAVGWGGYCAVYGALVVGGLVSPGGRRSGIERLGIGLFYLAFCAGAWVLWWRLGKARMIVDPETVVVVNPIHRYVLPSCESARLYATPSGWVVLETTRAKRIWVFGLSNDLPRTRRRRVAEISAITGIDLA